MATKHNRGYCGYFGVVIEGEKRNHIRGLEYELVVVLPNGDLVFGYEEGNYAGGVVLSPSSENYQERKNAKLESIKKRDKDFYNLIQSELIK